VGAIKVSRTLGQSQLNFAHTFFGSLIADESGLLSGSVPTQQPQHSKDSELGQLAIASPNVAFAGELN
jgi:hypothetical protein